MKEAYLLLGSNQGDRKSILKAAGDRLQELSVIRLVKSSLYETEPWGFKADNWFLNQAVKIVTDLDPLELLSKTLEIEKSLGRLRENQESQNSGYSSRTIDIDILLYEGVTCDTEKLQLPHPRLHLRKFALLPLCEISPELIHPGLKMNMEELLKQCDDNSEIRIIIDK